MFTRYTSAETCQSGWLGGFEEEEEEEEDDDDDEGEEEREGVPGGEGLGVIEWGWNWCEPLTAEEGFGWITVGMEFLW